MFNGKCNQIRNKTAKHPRWKWKQNEIIETCVITKKWCAAEIYPSQSSVYVIAKFATWFAHFMSAIFIGYFFIWSNWKFCTYSSNSKVEAIRFWLIIPSNRNVILQVVNLCSIDLPHTVVFHLHFFVSGEKSPVFNFKFFCSQRELNWKFATKCCALLHTAYFSNAMDVLCTAIPLYAVHSMSTRWTRDQTHSMYKKKENIIW